MRRDSTGAGGRMGVRAWIACMEQREEDAYERLMNHARGCERWAVAVARGELLDAAQLCAAGSGLLAVWDAAEDATASALALLAVSA